MSKFFTVAVVVMLVAMTISVTIATITMQTAVYATLAQLSDK